MLEYPRSRPKVFAVKVTRQLMKTCAAANIGPIGFALVNAVAATEDSAGYVRPVTFYDSQLMMILGIRKQHELAAARVKAVSFGWLKYEHGTKGRPGVYFVTIPDGINTDDDAPSDEGWDATVNESQTNPERILNESQTKKERIANESQTNLQPSSPVPGPNPVPSPIPHDGGSRDEISQMQAVIEAMANRLTMPCGESQEFRTWWAIHPLPVKRGRAWMAYQNAVIAVLRDAIAENVTISESGAHQTLLDGIRRYAASPVGSTAPEAGSRDYRLEPHSWLESKCWRDPESALLAGGNVRPPPSGAVTDSRMKEYEDYINAKGLK